MDNSLAMTLMGGACVLVPVSQQVSPSSHASPSSGTMQLTARQQLSPGQAARLMAVQPAAPRSRAPCSSNQLDASRLLQPEDLPTQSIDFEAIADSSVGGGGLPRPYGRFSAARCGDGTAVWERLPLATWSGSDGKKQEDREVNEHCAPEAFYPQLTPHERGTEYLAEYHRFLSKAPIINTCSFFSHADLSSALPTLPASEQRPCHLLPSRYGNSIPSDITEKQRATWPLQPHGSSPAA